MNKTIFYKTKLDTYRKELIAANRRGDLNSARYWNAQVLRACIKLRACTKVAS